MTEYGRDFNKWVEESGSKDHPIFGPGFVLAPEGSLILAGDDWGDSIYVLYPDGTLNQHTSDGNVHTKEDEDEEIGTLTKHLWEMLSSGLMSLG